MKSARRWRLINLLEIEHLGQSNEQQRQKNIDVARSRRVRCCRWWAIFSTAKIESGHFSVQLQPMSLSEVVRDCEALFRRWR